MEQQETILIASTNPENRRHLRTVLEERYNLLEAVNLRQAMMLLEQNPAGIASFVMGTSLITREDEAYLRSPAVSGPAGQLPVIVILEQESGIDPSTLFRNSASDVIPVDYDDYAMLRRIVTITDLHLHKVRLQSVIRDQEEVLRRSNDVMVDALSSIIEYRSEETGHHILRIRSFTKLLMDEVRSHLPQYSISERLVTVIASAAALHDIGKIAIPDAILLKPGPLTKEEMDVMKTHSLTGCRILDSLEDMADEEYLYYARSICRHHHERWDGRGYPDGLKGEEIPIWAQAVGLADAYDALTSKRVYKEACSFDQAVNMILQGDCGLFSPELLECFKHVAERFRTLTLEYADGQVPRTPPFDMTLPPARPEDGENTLDRIRNKYYALVHYIGGFLVEVNLDHGLFHVVYNPYPELARLDGITTLGQLADLMLDRIVVPQERERMYRLIFEEIPEFVDEDMRRSTHRFHYRPQGADPGGLFEMTLLRIAPGDPPRRSLCLLLRKLPDAGSQDRQLPHALAENAYICRNDQHFTLVQAGGYTRSLGGYTIEEIHRELGGRLGDIIHPEDRKMVREEFSNQLRNGTEVRLEHRVVTKHGNVRWVANHSFLFLGGDGREYLHSSLTDITRFREDAEAILAKHALYKEILTETQNVLFQWDLRTDAVSFSDTWSKILRLKLPGDSFSTWLARGDQFHPDDVPLLMDRIGALTHGSDYETAEVRIASDQGRYIWCRLRATARRDSQGKLLGVMGVITCVDAEKQAERVLKDRAERDSLTKLLNKAAGRRMVEEYLARYPSGPECAMLIIDLDNFKQVNDRYGHLFGDAVLTKVAQEIRRQFRSQDVLSRIGGDEFLVLVRGIADRSLLASRCRSFIDSLDAELRGYGYKLELSCSIGIALCPEQGSTYYDLFDRADQALYQAKAQGKDTFCFYTPQDRSDFMTAPGRVSAVNNRIDSDEEPGLAEDTIVRQLFHRLYTAADPEAAINEVIAALGRKMNVSRVYIFENTADGLFCNNTFEWCNTGISPEIDKLQMVSYETDIPGYDQNFDEQGMFYCPDVMALPPSAREIVQAQGIHSMLQCAIRQRGVFRGYIGFDECAGERLWTKEEIQLLAYFSEILSMFLLKHRQNQRIQSQAEDLHTILDNQNTCLYIIDPDSFQLKYANRKTRELMPGAACGEKCYRSLLGRDSPCLQCPARNIRQEQTARVVVQDEGSPRRFLLDGTLIQWQGEENCLVSCRLLPKDGGK